MLLVTLGIASAPSALQAQRLQQQMGRGVVVATRSGGRSVTSAGGQGTLISWRKLAQEPEGTVYNIYRRPAGTTSFTKVNSQPVAQTNYELTSVSSNYEYAVAAIVDGVEGDISKPFLYKTQSWPNVWFKFDFDNTVLKRDDYRTKYAWPMDTDGDGEIDALVCDRLFAGAANDDDAENPQESTATMTHKLQAYRLDGTLLWTVDMGPNVSICGGQNDMVLAYDINCDGHCEVITRTSDGTRFWDKENNTWGSYVGNNDDADTDGDGIIDYRSQSVKNPPFYISVIDGATGAELTYAELNYNELRDNSDAYSRNNRADYMNFNYAAMEGHYGIAYLDGLHPSLVMECEDRDKGGSHHGYIMSWDFDWADGTASNWHHSSTWTRNNKSGLNAEFHQIRILDSDGDGCDDMWTGSYGVNPLQNRYTTTNLAHGDRFIISDIDPDRPGLEGYSIQQSALLGQCLYDVATGERLKEWYLPSVYDVGRGACMDIDPEHKGYEIYSFADDFIYNCKGDKTSHTRSQSGISTMFEGCWWNGDLLREELSSPGGSGYGTNLMVTTVLGKNRLVEFSQESDWGTHAGTGTRPCFMGDLVGDWREEVILANQNADRSTGLVGYTTNIPSDYSIYCLQQDPHYRLDCTTRGYYQHPNTSFYLGVDMPLPPVPPVMEADLRYVSGTVESGKTAFTTFDMTRPTSFTDGQSLMFDLSGDNSQPVVISNDIAPSALYIINPKGHDYTFEGKGAITGQGQLVKSQLGVATLNNDVRLTGKTIISEGMLAVNGTISSPVELRAKGTLSGNATLTGAITFEGALNYEGCRLMPTGSDGVITFNHDLTLPGNIFVEVTAANSQCGHLQVNGNLTFEGQNTITVNHDSDIAGRYVIAQCTGQLKADASQLKTRGLTGINYELLTDGNQLLLVIIDTRDKAENVLWTGGENNLWDYQSENFSLDGATTFVPGDEVIFNADGQNRNITINDMVVPGSVTFTGGQYTFSGEGGISGQGGVTINSGASVTFNLKNSDYTGPTIVNGGTLTVPNFYDGGQKSAIGAASAALGNLQLGGGGTLVLSRDNMGTDRAILVTDTATIRISQSNSALSLKRQVQGSGYLVKDGPGQLNFAYGGANNFAGLIVKQGIVAQGAWNATFGRSGSPMLLCGGEVRLIDANNSSTRPILNHAITVQEGTKSVIRGTTRGAINGSMRGRGTVTIYSTGVRNDIGTDFSQFEGTLNAEGSNFRLMDNVTDMSKAHVVMAAGCYISHYNSNGSSQRAVNTKIGSLTAPASATTATLGHSQDSYEIGSLNEDMTFYGMLKASRITKVGTGKLSLRAPGHTSPITVNGGTLEVYSSSATAMTSGQITVNEGGTLSGNNRVSAVVINHGGTLASGIYPTIPGNIYMTNLTLQAGATLRCILSANANSRFTVTGNIRHNGDTLHIVVPATRKLEVGDELTIFPEGFKSATGDVVVKCEAADGMHYTFDTSALNTEGKVRVADVTDGIHGLIADETKVNVYTTDGICVRREVQKGQALNHLPQGIYILQSERIRQKVFKR